MKIGVTYENGQIFQHFGHTAQFKIYDVEDGKVVASEVVDTNGSGHGALAGFLLENQVDVLNTSQWDAIHSGMRMVVENLDSFAGCTLPVAGKTGTAQQVETRPNHALFVGYTPYDNPELSIAVRIAYGYSSHNAASAARNIFSYYYQQQSLEELLALKASGVNSSTATTVTD